MLSLLGCKKLPFRPGDSGHHLAVDPMERVENAEGAWQISLGSLTDLCELLGLGHDTKSG